MKLKRLVEQHFHGAFGVDFNTAIADDILYLSRELYKCGYGYIFPTLVTDSVDNIKHQLSVVSDAMQRQTSDMAKIAGVHLEGIFINPLKKGIHDENYFLTPSIDNFKLLESDIIKIITVAPELCEDNFIEYLHENKIKVQAGHCIGANLSGIDGTTHTFNAMMAISHKEPSTALSALVNDDIYTEIIADGVHVNDDALRLLFKAKPADKILLVSDCLSCTKSDLKEFDFAGQHIYYNGLKAASKDGTLAGSTTLLPDIIKLLVSKNMFNKQFIENSYIYHNLADIGEFEL